MLSLCISYLASIIYLPMGCFISVNWVSSSAIFGHGIINPKSVSIGLLTFSLWVFVFAASVSSAMSQLQDMCTATKAVGISFPPPHFWILWKNLTWNCRTWCSWGLYFAWSRLQVTVQMKRFLDPVGLDLWTNDKLCIEPGPSMAARHHYLPVFVMVTSQMCFPQEVWFSILFMFCTVICQGFLFFLANHPMVDGDCVTWNILQWGSHLSITDPLY